MPSCRLQLHITVAASLCMVTSVTMARPGHAQVIGLAFDLPKVAESVPTSPASEPAYRPLPIPPGATQPPTRGPDAARQNPRAYQSKASPSAALTAHLPPPPGAIPEPRVLAPQTAQAPAPPAAAPAPKASTSANDIALGFPAGASPRTAVYAAAKDNPQPPAPEAPSPTHPKNATQPDETDWIFNGGSNSLVARVIGSAEGTRTPTGERTRHFNGHRDPGNGVWNLGTFSYQHGAASPEEADVKQLARLARQEETLDRKAERLGLQLTLFERLNALDLANQSPAAALNQGGYIDRLYQAQQAGRTGDEAILWARTYSYMNPKTQRWNAPGLGNTYQSIRRDQNRRLRAIASALDAYQIQQAMADSTPTPTNPSTASVAQTVETDPTATPTEIADKSDNTEAFTAPGNAVDNPIAFGLSSATQTSERPVTEQPSATHTSPTNINHLDRDDGQTISQPPPAIRLSTLQSSATPLEPSQVDRLLRSRENNDTTPGALAATSSPAPQE